MNTLVTYPIAKLLKEKGFNLHVNHYFENNGKREVQQNLYKADYNHSTSVGLTHSRPAISDVVVWLYEKHNIWIWSERFSTMFRPYAEELGNERFGKWEGHKYNSPTEAYLAAIEYIITLIK